MHIQTQTHTQNNVVNLNVATIDDIDLDLALADIDLTSDQKKTSVILSAAPSKFDYALIATEPLRKQAQAAAIRIRANMVKTQATYIEVGRDLLAMKKELAHGQFGKWIESEFSMNIRSAQNMMNAAELADDYEALIVLPATVIYKLASKSTPAELKQKIAKQVKDGMMPADKEIILQITEAKSVQQQQKNAERANRDIEQQWKKHEKQLRETGSPDKDYDAERKAWDTKNATAECTKLKNETAKMSAITANAVELLQKGLGADFEAFCALLSKNEAFKDFRTALQAA